MAGSERIEVFYSGRVQGVGFRYNAIEQSRGLILTGWVRNLSDGRVQMVGEGSIADLKELLNRIDKSMRENITDRTVDWQSPTGMLGTFTVRP